MHNATLCVAALLAIGSIGLANAAPTNTNLVQNGDFSSIDASLMQGGDQVPTQFGTQNLNGFAAQQFINHWIGDDGYEIWFNNATDAGSVNAYSVWGQGSSMNVGTEHLWQVTAPPHGTAFVGLDGDFQTPDLQSSIGQQLTGLIPGTQYTVSFDWAAAQMRSRLGATTNSLVVAFGNASQTTNVVSIPSMGFSGWLSQSFTFVADSSSAFLNFLAVGTPKGLPPMALLSGVSVTGPHSVPEPSVLGMFGGGLLGLTLITLYTRRRALRERDDLA